MVFQFKETMPIVVALGNKYLEKVHWDEIYILLGEPNINLEDREFNLGQLINLNVANYQ